MKEKQRIYSYRKFKGIGLASAVVGLAFLTPSNGGGGNACSSCGECD